MSNPSITKTALANSLKDVMKEKPLSKININDITDRCDLNRKTFYYHFKDKYDLVNWIFYTEFLSSLHICENKNTWNLLESICNYLHSNRQFYTNALEVDGQNSFEEYFMEIMKQLISSHFLELFEYVEFQYQDEKNICIDYLADMTSGVICRWLVEDSEIEPDKFIGMVKRSTIGITQYILESTKTK